MLAKEERGVHEGEKMREARFGDEKGRFSTGRVDASQRLIQQPSVTRKDSQQRKRALRLATSLAKKLHASLLDRFNPARPRCASLSSSGSHWPCAMSSSLSARRSASNAWRVAMKGRLGCGSGARESAAEQGERGTETRQADAPG